MPSKGFKTQYVLLCDDVREEVSGKSTIVGLYNDSLIFSEGTETALLPLAIFVRGRFLGDSRINVELWIEHPNGERGPSVQWEKIGPKIEVGKPGHDNAILVWKLSPWRMAGLGKYKLHLVQGSRDEVIHEFEAVASN